MTVIKKFIIVIVLLSGVINIAQARTYGVFVGLCEYGRDDVEPYKANYNDAVDMCNLYKSTIKDGEFLLITNKGATTDNILNVAKKLFSKATKNDNIVFFISTHGYDGGVSTYDGWMSTQQIREVFHNSKAANKYVIVNSCHSGSFNTVPETQENSHNNSFGRMSQVALNGRSNVVILTSTRNDMYSYTYLGENDNSIFVGILLQGLKGAADYDNNNVVTIGETYKYIRERFKYDEDQIPQLMGRFNNNSPFIR